MYAQLGFCQGNSGDPIFTEDFGTGTSYGPQLPVGTTTYSFVNFNGPQDGQYTVGSSTFSYGWNLPSDHTPNDVNGKSLIVNASFTPGVFYTRSVSGLCENTTYEFSAWLINILPSNGCGGNSIPVNVRFEIWDNTDTNLLASGNTGNIVSIAAPIWEQYGLVFQTLPSQTSVILKMINNGSGGCGNDLAIDDIVFKSCGDSIMVEDTSNNNSIEICSALTPYATTLTVVPDNTVFSTHFYQWQVSNDGSIWTDITGETNSTINISNINTTTLYRVKVAEFPSNLNNSDCITFSDVHQITVNQAPNAPTTECWQTATLDAATCSWTLSGIQPNPPTGLECWETTTFNTATCVWEVTGTQPNPPTGLECWETTTFNTTTCRWEITGTQPIMPTTECWETTTFNTATCVWEVTGTQPNPPTGLECWETTTFNTTTCRWDITGTQPIMPTTECWETTTFNTATCVWEVTGTQPNPPTGLECWETTTFNTTTCRWDVTGTQPTMPTTECWETTTFNTTTCVWEVTGTQPNAPTGLECWETTTFNTTTCRWEITGTQPIMPTTECWQTAVFNNETCVWDIEGTQTVETRTENLFICQDETLELQANSFIDNPSYQWIPTAQTTSSIVIENAGIYEVEVTNGCLTEHIIFNVTLIENPVIERIISDDKSIVITLSNTGDYLYSIDGINYQYSPVFNVVSTGMYTVYVKSLFCDAIIIQKHLHFFIQKFITPNNDDVNDVLKINITEYFTSSQVYIYDRYGKLLFSAINRDVNWDGTFNNVKLPNSDYWYYIILGNAEFKGHFTLKR